MECRTEKDISDLQCPGTELDKEWLQLIEIFKIY